MSKYQITHACGHTVEHSIIGAVSGRDSRAQYLASRVCEGCYRAQQRTAAEAATAALPALEGSEKQVGWATTIRAKAAAELRALRAHTAPYAETGDPAALRALEIIDATVSSKSAKDWIEARGVVFDRTWLARKLTK